MDKKQTAIDKMRIDKMRISEKTEETKGAQSRIDLMKI